MTDSIRKSFLAGLLIGLGGFAFLSVNSPYVGAFLFSIGLISVILLGCNLYTGKVGYARSFKDFSRLPLMCLLNIIAACMMGVATSPVVSEKAMQTAGKKLAKEPLEIFISAVICGALIYLAVELYKRTQNILMIILPVFTFVSVGADHCIANAYYFAAAGEISAEAVIYLLICIIGNAAGSLMISLLQVERI